jgi:ATP-dependent Clp protease ATP-binding subunit ClpX
MKDESEKIKDKKQINVICSFCNKNEYEVCKLVSNHQFYICDLCVKLCSRILNKKSVKIKSQIDVFKPKKIKTILNSYIIPQSNTKLQSH